MKLSLHNITDPIFIKLTPLHGSLATANINS